MSTRSRIGIELSNGSVLSVYHHWDGYPQWLGKTLVEHFNTPESVSELIDGGDMSTCWTNNRWDSEVLRRTIVNSDGSTRSEIVYDSDNQMIYTNVKSEFGPQYYSERGEDCPPRLDDTVGDYLQNGEEYAYLYTSDGEWVCYDRNEYSDNDIEIVDIPSK
jgi:hypothetical protein